MYGTRWRLFLLLGPVAATITLLRLMALLPGAMASAGESQALLLAMLVLVPLLLTFVLPTAHTLAEMGDAESKGELDHLIRYKHEGISTPDSHGQARRSRLRPVESQRLAPASEEGLTHLVRLKRQGTWNSQHRQGSQGQREA